MLHIHCPGSNADEDKAEIRQHFAQDGKIVNVTDSKSLRNALEVYGDLNPPQNFSRLEWSLSDPACPRRREKDYTCETSIPEKGFPAGSLFVVRHRTCQIRERIKTALQEAEEDEMFD